MKEANPSAENFAGRKKLGELKKGQKGLIVKVCCGLPEKQGEHDCSSRLMEMGLVEGALVEVVHEAPFFGDPIAVQVQNTLLGIRRKEANQVEVMTQETDSR